MRKPVTEHETTLSSKKHKPEAAGGSGHPIEAVPGGRVRRIVFAGEEPAAPAAPAAPTPAPAPARAPASAPVEFREVERRYLPRHAASIADIERDVDRIIGRPQSSPIERTYRSTRTVYQTPRGEVTEEVRHTAEGRKRALYVSRKEGSVTTEKRFVASEVDRLIAERPPRQRRPTLEDTMREVHETKRETVRESSSSSSPKAHPAVPTPEVEERREPTFQPQCGAVTAAGKQCRNSCKEGSKYCGSHQGYRPVTVAQALEGTRTKPAVRQAKNTAALGGSKNKPGGYQAQCAALAAGGKQCRNSSRDGSKYCGAHRNYKPASAVAAMDTKPRHAKAKDTKPSLKKSKAKGKASKSTAASRASAKRPASAKKSTAAKGPAKKAAKKSKRAAATKTAKAPSKATKKGKKATTKAARKPTKASRKRRR
jgi:hypothetical protein